MGIQFFLFQTSCGPPLFRGVFFLPRIPLSSKRPQKGSEFRAREEDDDESESKIFAFFFFFFSRLASTDDEVDDNFLLPVSTNFWNGKSQRGRDWETRSRERPETNTELERLSRTFHGFKRRRGIENRNQRWQHPMD